MQKVNINELLNAEDVKELEKFAQVIPAEMMQEIVIAAKAKDVSIEVEIMSRFLATIDQPENFGFKSAIEIILKQGFSADDAVAECKRKRQHWFYVYEVEKLRLFLMFQEKMPRNVKENFLLIDVKAETKRILAEMKANENANKKKGKDEE